MKKIDYDQVFQKITMNWFYTNPILFSVFCKCKMRENSSINVPFRTGIGVIEFNPELLGRRTPQIIRKYLEMELYRIMLRHPYRKKPDMADEDLWFMASNLAISPEYARSKGYSHMQSIEYYYRILSEESKKEQEEDEDDDNMNLQNKGDETDAEDSTTDYMSFMDSMNKDNSLEDLENQESEEYQTNLESIEKENQSSDSDNNDCDDQENTETGAGNFGTEDETQENETSNTDENDEDDETEDSGKSNGATDLWGENIVEEAKIIQRIAQAAKTSSWGRLPGNIQQVLLMNTNTKLPELKKMLRYFKCRTGEDNRTLTRMRPNRRWGFQQMGSRYKPKPSRILVGIDVSGSVSDDAVSDFYGAVNDVFVHGIKKIDVLQFDEKLVNEVPVPFRKSKIDLKGRGGTNFQPIIDYAHNHNKLYDGLIVFTDGYAYKPKFPENFKTKLFWVIINKQGVQPWMKKSGMAAYIYDSQESNPLAVVFS